MNDETAWNARVVERGRRSADVRNQQKPASQVDEAERVQHATLVTEKAEGRGRLRACVDRQQADEVNPRFNTDCTIGVA